MCYLRYGNFAVTLQRELREEGISRREEREERRENSESPDLRVVETSAQCSNLTPHSTLLTPH